MNNKLYYFMFLQIVFLSFNCQLNDSFEGNYQIKYDKSSNQIQSITTQSNGVVAVNSEYYYIKVHPYTQVTFNQNQKIQLQEGVITYINNKKNYYQKKRIYDINFSDKILFSAEQGKALFYRIKTEKKYLLKSQVQIKYWINDNGSFKIREINVHMDEIYNKKGHRYYGFFIPLNLFWDIKKIEVHLFLTINHIYYSERIKVIDMDAKEWEKQTIRFKQKKSKELLSTDKSKFQEEKRIRQKIWNYHQKKPYFINKGYIFPLKKEGYITSEFGLIREWRLSNGRIYLRNIHMGLDIALPLDTPVYAPADGFVQYARKAELLGNTIIIDHGLSFFTDYSHLNKIMVHEGSFVKQGDLIGTVGATGAATGPHLHWGGRLYGMIVDPRSFMELHQILLD